MLDLGPWVGHEEEELGELLVRSMAWLGCLFAGLVWAQEPEFVVNDVEGVLSALAEGHPGVDVATAIRDSTGKFRPRDLYVLADEEVDQEVLKAMAARTSIFFDANNVRSLSDYAAGFRSGQPQKSFEVGAGGLTAVMVWFKELEDQRQVLVDGVAAPEAQALDELDHAYDLRVRGHQQQLARLTGPLDGQIESTVLKVDIPAVGGPHDGSCGVLLVEEMPEVDFFTFRGGMGVTDRQNLITVETRSVAEAMFQTSPRRALAIRSQNVCVPASQWASTGRSAKLRGVLQRTANGRWSGDLEFMDGYGDRIRTRR